MRVLVVDDSPGVRRRLVALLREAGLEVAEADGVAAALARVATEPPDAIVVDVLLADRRGLEVVPALRAGARDAILLVLTNAPWYRRHCLALGADFVLDKSTEFEDVVGTLTRLR